VILEEGKKNLKRLGTYKQQLPRKLTKTYNQDIIQGGRRSHVNIHGGKPGIQAGKGLG